MLCFLVLRVCFCHCHCLCRCIYLSLQNINDFFLPFIRKKAHQRIDNNMADEMSRKIEATENCNRNNINRRFFELQAFTQERRIEKRRNAKKNYDTVKNSLIAPTTKNIATIQKRDVFITDLYRLLCRRIVEPLHLTRKHAHCTPNQTIDLFNFLGNYFLRARAAHENNNNNKKRQETCIQYTFTIYI